MHISELYRYPLKGGMAERLTETPLLDTGFPDDRRWLLVDAAGRFVSQRSHPALALVKIRQSERLLLQAGGKTLELDPSARSDSRLVTVWSDTVSAMDLGDEAAAFISAALGSPMRLCEAKPGSERIADQTYTDAHSVPYLFADGFPYLVISQESLDLLNEKLGARGQAEIGIDRFRPNIVVSGWQAHAEDNLQTLRIGPNIELRLCKPCSRCNVIVVNQETGHVGTEPLATLASYRKLGGSKIYFGMNAWLSRGAGEVIRVGDSVVSLKPH